MEKTKQVQDIMDQETLDFITESTSIDEVQDVIPKGDLS
jgi:hypothetical protein